MDQVTNEHWLKTAESEIELFDGDVKYSDTNDLDWARAMIELEGVYSSIVPQAPEYPRLQKICQQLFEWHDLIKAAGYYYPEAMIADVLGLTNPEEET